MEKASDAAEDAGSGGKIYAVVFEVQKQGACDSILRNYS